MTIKEWLEKTGLSIKEASEKTGVPYRTLQNWANGSRKPPEYVERLITQADKMNVAPRLQGEREPEFNLGFAYGLIFTSTGVIPDWQRIQHDPLKRYGIIFGKLITKIPKKVQDEIVPYMADLPWQFSEKKAAEIDTGNLLLGYYAGVKWCLDHNYYKADKSMILG